MAATLFNLAAAGSGRGEDPSGVGGVLIVVGIALAVILLGATLAFVFLRRGRARPFIFRRRRHRSGRIGRVT
jgi:hypothetical protein